MAVSLTLRFKVRRQDGTVEESGEITATISPKVHNWVSLWRTTVNNIGLPLIPEYETWVGEATTAATSAFYGANYGKSASILDLSGLQQAQWGATADFGLTHGGASGVNDSLGITNDHLMVWDEFFLSLGHFGARYRESWAPTHTPPTSLVFFYACTTYPNAPPSKFWLWREPLQLEGDIVDAAVLGFNKPYGFQPNEALHIGRLFEKLNQGFKLADAVDFANAAFPLAASSGQRGDKADLKLQGDGGATFSTVYLTAAQRALTGMDPYPGWYWLPPFGG